MASCKKSQIAARVGLPINHAITLNLVSTYIYASTGFLGRHQA
jgi:hypothetical protein